MAQKPDRILDELLVIGCQRGDETAFEQLVACWHDRLKRHACQLTGDVDAGAEIVQDAWAEIVRTIGSLREPTSFRGWAFRIVSNKAADWIRDRSKQRTLRDTLESGMSPAGCKHDSGQRNDDLEYALQQLPDVSRQILSMKYLDGLSTREIADAMNIPPGTVKSRLFHAREQIRREIERNSNE